MTETITQAQYRAFQEAYDFFNAELFAGSLPHVLVTLQRHAKARGYFSPERFTGRTREDRRARTGDEPGHLHRAHRRGNTFDARP